MRTEYHAFAHFTRHIRPGTRILLADAGNSVAAHDLTFELSAFGQASGGTSGRIARWSTATSGGGDRYVRRTDARVSDKRVTVPFAAGRSRPWRSTTWRSDVASRGVSRPLPGSPGLSRRAAPRRPGLGGGIRRQVRLPGAVAVQGMFA
ncbi:hypothetical protein NKH77_02200 [Streptomyces sp. M19]